MTTTFVKIQEFHRSKCEAERMNWARGKALRTESFLVPQVIAIHGDELIQERLEGFQPLLNIKDEISAPETLASRLGRILAVIHDDSDSNFCGNGEPRHGDYTCENILYNDRDGKIAVVDWSDAKWYSNTLTSPQAHVDLAIFVMSAFQAGTFGKEKLSPKEFLESFFSSYESATTTPLRRNAFRESFPTLLGLFLGYKWSLRARLRLLIHRQCYLEARNFIERRYGSKQWTLSK